MSLLCLTPHTYSSLKNIYLVAIFHFHLQEVFGNELIFAHLICDITSVETDGIMINGKKFDFVLSGILGDNMGINTIFGFTESVNANFCCRFSKASKK